MRKQLGRVLNIRLDAPSLKAVGKLRDEGWNISGLVRILVCEAERDNTLRDRLRSVKVKI